MTKLDNFEQALNEHTSLLLVFGDNALPEYTKILQDPEKTKIFNEAADSLESLLTTRGNTFLNYYIIKQNLLKTNNIMPKITMLFNHSIIKNQSNIYHSSNYFTLIFQHFSNYHFLKPYTAQIFKYFFEHLHFDISRYNSQSKTCEFFLNNIDNPAFKIIQPIHKFIMLLHIMDMRGSIIHNFDKNVFKDKINSFINNISNDDISTFLTSIHNKIDASNYYNNTYYTLNLIDKNISPKITKEFLLATERPIKNLESLSHSDIFKTAFYFPYLSVNTQRNYNKNDLAIALEYAISDLSQYYDNQALEPLEDFYVIHRTSTERDELRASYIRNTKILLEVFKDNPEQNEEFQLLFLICLDYQPVMLNTEENQKKFELTLQLLQHCSISTLEHIDNYLNMGEQDNSMTPRVLYDFQRYEKNENIKFLVKELLYNKTMPKAVASSKANKF